MNHFMVVALRWRFAVGDDFENPDWFLSSLYVPNCIQSITLGVPASKHPDTMGPRVLILVLAFRRIPAPKPIGPNITRSVASDPWYLVRDRGLNIRPFLKTQIQNVNLRQHSSVGVIPSMHQHIHTVSHKTPNMAFPRVAGIPLTDFDLPSMIGDIKGP
jgi:hypothetical protein